MFDTEKSVHGQDANLTGKEAQETICLGQVGLDHTSVDCTVILYTLKLHIMHTFGPPCVLLDISTP